MLWLTDNDDFVANDQRVIDLTPLFGGIIGGYVGHALGHFRFGTMKCDAGDLQIEDLTAIPDLIAGAACEIPLHFSNPTRAAIRVPLRDHVSAKGLTILDWMGRRHMPLKRLLFLVDEGDLPGMIKVKALEISLTHSTRFRANHSNTAFGGTLALSGTSQVTFRCHYSLRRPHNGGKL